MPRVTHTPNSQTDSAGRIDDLERRLQEKSAEAEALKRIGQAIGLMLDMPRMLQMVAEIVQQVTGTDVCLIYFLNDSKTELVLRAASSMARGVVGKVRMKVGEGVTGWVAETRERVALDSNAFRDSRFKLVPELQQDGFHSLLSVPLIGREDLLGVINVRTDKAHKYTASQIELLESIAGQVAGAIENSAQFQRVQRRASQLTTLSEISRTISSSLYLEEILQFIVAVTAESMNLSICSVMLLDEEKQELIIKATTSQSRAYIKKPNLRLGESLAGRAVAEAKPVSVLDVKRTSTYRYPDIAKAEGLCSLVCVPMVIKGRIIGVLNCYTSKPHHFTEEEISLLSALASHAAIAIENSQLHVRTAILQEMHHRVKNNLQTVASLLRLQMRYDKQVTVETALSESINRIQAIAAVHDMLSREDLATVSVRKLAETILAAQCSSSLPVGHAVQAQVEGPDILLASHHATSVALVLSELIQNALEHGIQDAAGTIRVLIELMEDDVRIAVENSGRPLPETCDLTKRNLGLQIVENLVHEELAGAFELTGGEVTRAAMTFPR
jgi:GAF domain-containing protein